jgi:recombination DNA repair RAD52 pathway protein
MEIMKLPTMQDLITDTEDSLKQNALTVLLNQNPPAQWLVTHPMIRDYKYIPIEKVEYLLTRIFGQWSVEIRSTQVVANSVVVTVRLHVTNPVNGQPMWQDGIGAAPIQTDKGAGATDWNAVKTDGVQKAAPAAETYAIKDAAEKFGKIFGRDVSRKTTMDYNPLLKKSDFNSELEK